MKIDLEHIRNPEYLREALVELFSFDEEKIIIPNKLKNALESNLPDLTELVAEFLVINIVKGFLHIDEQKISLSTRFYGDLEADSLDLVELIMAFEDVAGVDIMDEEAQSIQNIGDAIKLVKEHLASSLHKKE